MNCQLLVIQMLGISLASFSHLFCGEEDPLSDNEKRREIIGKLAQDMGARYRTENVKRNKLIDSLAEGMHRVDKAKVIDALGRASAERLTEDFENTVNRLTQGISERSKSDVICALASIPAERLRAFENTVNSLPWADKYSQARGITALARIPAERLTAIEKTVERFVHEQDGYTQAHVIEALGYLPAEKLTKDFEKAVNRLDEGLDPGSLPIVISVLGHLPAVHWPMFEVTTNHLAQIGHKYYAIQALAKIPAEQFADFANAFPDQTLQQLNNFVPYFERGQFMIRLATMQPDQWQAEITRVINEYRHENAAQPWVNPMEIHNYANTQVTTSGSLGSALPMRLDDAVIENMNQRLQAVNVPSMDYAEAKALLNTWIEAKYSNSNRNVETVKEAAFAKLVSDTDYEEVISTAVSFLRTFHPGKEGLWLDGFLGESIKANSCNKGIKERVATGMRTIDTELDKLFAEAEGNLTFSIYCNNWNLSDKSRALKNLRWVADKLYAKGVTAGTSAKKVAEAVEALIAEDLSTSSPENSDTAKSLAVGAVNAYWEEIKGQFSLIEGRALKAEQDAEHAASVTADLAPTRLSTEEERAARIRVMDKKKTE